MFRLTFGLAVLSLLLKESTLAQKCKDREDDEVRYLRVYYGSDRGATGVPSSWQSAAKALGKCRSPASHAEKAINYFEGFGADLSIMKRRPYQVYEDSSMNISPYLPSPHAEHVIYLSTFYEYANFLNTPFKYSSWYLTAKTNMTGQRGSFPAGSFVMYGMLRSQEHGQALCIEYFAKSPLTFAFAAGNPVPLELVVHHDFWGEGVFRGLLRFGNGTLDQDFVMTFPAEQA